MKKLLNKSVGLVLAVFLFISLLVAWATTIDFSLLRTKAEYSRDYEELLDEELDEMSYRSTPGSGAPQITVLTHGLGCDPSYWSHIVTMDEQGTEKWVFGYQGFSIIERLRQKIGENETTVMTASVGFGKKALEWANIVKTKEAAKSQPISEDSGVTDKSYPAPSLRAEYHNFDKMDNDRQINLYSCNKRAGNGYEYTTSVDKNRVVHNLQATDVNKHIIIVFESIEPKTKDEDTVAQNNDYVYAQLEYILDVLSYQYCQLTGVLPTYNLIGHSRGGITNLQYALAHPNNVTSLYSMGTPYGGSVFGSATIGENHVFLKIAGYERDVEYITSGGNEKEIDYNPGILDTLDKELTDSYRNYWNDNYNKYYRHIRFRPIGTYVTFEFFVQVLVEYIEGKANISTGWEGVDEIAEEVKEEIVYFCQEILDGAEYLQETFLGTQLMKYETELWIKRLGKLLSKCGINDFAAICNNIKTGTVSYPHIGTIRQGSYVIEDDLFIDLDSQIAEGYSGRNVVVKLMNIKDGKNVDYKKCTDNVGVGHNLETQNSDIVDYIIGTIDLGIEQTFSYEKIEGGYSIKNLNIDKEGVLEIPQFYKGEPVISIDRLSRDINIGGTESYHSKITKIIIPNTIREISDYAFYGMSNLKTVEFANGSVLESVGVGAFMNCKLLTGIVLPDTVKEIEMGAFSGCGAITSFVVGKEVTYLGAGSFIGCDKLTEISVEDGNSKYSSHDGILFNEKGTVLLAYPQGRAGASYTVPSGVTEIGDYAFATNSKLQVLNLNQTTMIRQYGLADCSALTTITTNTLKYAEIGALDGTTWFQNQTGDQVVLGEVLLSYQGNATEVSLQNISSIAPYAFAGNTNLQRLIINSPLHNIGGGAFFQCENLAEIYLNNTNRMVFIGMNSFGTNSESRKIYVPQNLYDEYINNDFWKQYIDEITVHQTKIVFDSNGGSVCADGTVGYLDYVGELPVPQKDGYVFLGWYDNPEFTGKPVEMGLLWESLENEIALYAKYRQKSETVYSINYHPNGGKIADDAIRTYTIDDEVTLPSITREHYEFLGWYYDAEFTQPAGNGWGMDEETGNKDLYAKWRGVLVTITVKYGSEVLGQVKLFYGSRAQFPTFDGVVKNGYVFYGWAEENTSVRITDQDGMLLEPWERAENLTLQVIAVFAPEVYKITIVAPEGAIVPEISPTYTIESETIELPDASLDGYEFGGWVCNGKPIYNIAHGSVGDKTIEAIFNKIYIISFDAAGGRFCGNLYGIEGESVRLPSSYRKGCTGKWDTYSFGAQFVIPDHDVKFTARWTPNQYDLVYKIFDSTLKQTTYTYYEKDLIRQVTTEDPIYGLWRPTASSSSYVFDGWYKNRNFTTVISKIAEGTTGTVTVYGRWKYVRNEQITVTDDGVFSQPYDSVTFKQMTGYTLSQLKAKGYKTVTFTGSLTAWQKDDGYKYVQVYDGTGSNATKISEWWVDHRDGKTKRVYQLNNDGSWTFNLDALTSETLCFRYTASGTFNDTWYNSNFSIWVSNIN